MNPQRLNSQPHETLLMTILEITFEPQAQGPGIPRSGCSSSWYQVVPSCPLSVINV